jgi:hypothetical protein
MRYRLEYRVKEIRKNYKLKKQMRDKKTIGYLVDFLQIPPAAQISAGVSE